MTVWQPRSPRFLLILSVCIAATLLALGGLVSATRALRAEAREKYFDQYNRQQLLLAQEASNTIQEQFDSIYLSLTLASRLLENHDLDLSAREAIGREMRKVLESMTGFPVVEYAVFDRDGTVVGMAPEDAYTLGRNFSYREYYRWARDVGGPGQRYLSPFMEMAGGLYRGDKALIAALGLYDPEGELRGVIIGLINFDEIARRYVLSVRIGEHGYAWLVDSKNNSILVDPRGTVSGQSFDEAFLPRWPKLHALLVNTRNGEPGMDWYEFEDPATPGQKTRKLVGYAPIRLGDRLWTLGVCTPVGEVEGLMASVIHRQEVLSAISIVATLAGALTVTVLLITWNRSLSREVVTQTRALSQARQKLESTFEELLSAKKFAALGRLSLGIVHEIRNPLSSVRMNMQMIRRKIGNGSELDENFGIVEEEIHRLNRLLNDVMGFARPAPLRIESVDAVELVRKVLLLVEKQMEDDGVRVSIRWNVAPTRLRCDAEQIRQVLLNLILNAADATREVAGPRQVTVEILREGPWVSFRVADTGRGISEEDQDKIFDLFYTTKAQGGGLGLSIAQNVAIRHGGSIEVQSAPGRGACFTVQLPADGPPPAEAART